MKHLAGLTLSLLSLCLCLTGCLSYQPLPKTAIVEALGIDYREGEFQLTLQTYLPQSSGTDSNVEAGRSNTMLIQSKGETLEEAFRQATLLQGKTVNLGFCQLLVLGQETATEKLAAVTDYFDTLARTRWTMQVVLADGDAKGVVSAQFKQGISEGAQISGLLQEQSGKGFLCARTYFECSRMLTNQDGLSVLPILSLRQPAANEEGAIEESTMIFAETSGIITDYALTSLLTPQETRGFLLLTGNTNRREESVLTSSGEETVVLSAIHITCRQEERQTVLSLSLDAAPKSMRPSPEWMDCLLEELLPELQGVCQKLQQTGVDPARFLENRKIPEGALLPDHPVVVEVTVHEKKAE